MFKNLKIYIFIFMLVCLSLTKFEHQKLAFKLLKGFEKEDLKSNINFSPFSLEAAFQMVLEGSNGVTTQSLLKTFGYERDTTTRLENAKEMIKSMTNANKAYQLEIANQIIPDKSLELRKSFISTLKQYYLSTITPQDFIHEPEKARGYINLWVENVTHNKIKDLLPMGSISSQTRLVIVNALYFKAKWLYKFDIEQTMKDKFYLDRKNTINTEMMHLNEIINYHEDKSYKVIELPYQGNDISMFIVLPKKIEVSPLYTFDSFQLFKLEKLMKQKRVKVSLPKFKFEWSKLLNDPLTKVGLKYCFSDSADFSNMCPSENISITKVIQKTFIEVNELGTEAAAATAIVFDEAMMMEPETDHIFKADHPFSFYIIHKQFGKILFEGKLSNPKA